MSQLPPSTIRLGVISTFPPGKGSLNEYAFHFINALRQKPEVAELLLFVDELPPGKKYEVEGEGAPLRFIPCWRFDDPLNALRITRAVHQNRPDIVLFNIQFASFGQSKITGALGLLTPALMRLLKIPTIVLLHNILETINLKSAGFASNYLMEKTIRFFGRAATRLLLQANLMALTIPQYVDIIKKEYGAENVVLAPHGTFELDLPDTPPPLPAGPLQIMSFGKFGTYKKIEVLIEAFDKLQQDPQRPPIELVIAGSDNPNAKGYLESMRTEYAHVPNIRFTGYVAEEDVPRIFSEAAVTIFPYTSTTGSSGVLHQAGSYGKAAVLPNIGDFAQVIQDEGYTGEFFQPDDVDSLASAIARVIDNPEHRDRLGHQNLLAANGLSIEEIADWYTLHMQYLLMEKTGGSEQEPVAV